MNSRGTILTESVNARKVLEDWKGVKKLKLRKIRKSYEVGADWIYVVKSIIARAQLFPGLVANMDIKSKLDLDLREAVETMYGKEPSIENVFDVVKSNTKIRGREPNESLEKALKRVKFNAKSHHWKEAIQELIVDLTREVGAPREGESKKMIKYINNKLLPKKKSLLEEAKMKKIADNYDKFILFLKDSASSWDSSNVTPKQWVKKFGDRDSDDDDSSDSSSTSSSSTSSSSSGSKRKKKKMKKHEKKARHERKKAERKLKQEERFRKKLEQRSGGVVINTDAKPAWATELISQVKDLTSKVKPSRGIGVHYADFDDIFNDAELETESDLECMYMAAMQGIACRFCGGPHKVAQCPKLKQRMNFSGVKNDEVAFRNGEFVPRSVRVRYINQEEIQQLPPSNSLFAMQQRSSVNYQPVCGLWDSGCGPVVGPLHLVKDYLLAHKELKDLPRNPKFKDEPHLIYANQTKQDLWGAGIVSVEVKAGAEIARKEVIIYIVDDPRWTKILFGRSLMQKLGINPADTDSLEAMMKAARLRDGKN